MGNALQNKCDQFVDAVPDFPVEQCRPTPRTRTQQKAVAVQEMTEQEMLEAAREGRKKDAAKRASQTAAHKQSPPVNIEEKPSPPKEPKPANQRAHGITDKELRKVATQNKVAANAMNERQRQNLALTTGAQYETDFRAMQREPSLGHIDGYKASAAGLYFDRMDTTPTLESTKRVTINVEKDDITPKEPCDESATVAKTDSLNFWALTSGLQDDVAPRQRQTLNSEPYSFVVSDTLLEEARVS